MRAVFLFPLFVLITGATRSDAQARPCPAPGTLAAELRSRAVEIIIDSGYVATRSELGITPGDTSDVSIVTATDVCDAVTREVDSRSLKGPRATSLMVVKFQRFYAATAPEQGRIEALYIFDDAYRLKFVFTGT